MVKLHVSSVTRSSSGVHETVFAARYRIQLFLILSFVCHVLYNWIPYLAAKTVSWTPDDERVTLETCRVLPSNKEHKKLHLVGTYMIIILTHSHGKKFNVPGRLHRDDVRRQGFTLWRPKLTWIVFKIYFVPQTKQPLLLLTKKSVNAVQGNNRHLL